MVHNFVCQKITLYILVEQMRIADWETSRKLSPNLQRFEMVQVTLRRNPTETPAPVEWTRRISGLTTPLFITWSRRGAPSPEVDQVNLLAATLAQLKNRQISILLIFSQVPKLTNKCNLKPRL